MSLNFKSNWTHFTAMKYRNIRDKFHIIHKLIWKLLCEMEKYITVISNLRLRLRKNVFGTALSMKSLQLAKHTSISL